MEKDRTAILSIMNEIPESLLNDLEQYIDGVRAQTLGWAYADACVSLDRGIDYRTIEAPSIFSRAMSDLA